MLQKNTDKSMNIKGGALFLDCTQVQSLMEKVVATILG
jgi:hypothetical protein